MLRMIWEIFGYSRYNHTEVYLIQSYIDNSWKVNHALFLEKTVGKRNGCCSQKIDLILLGPFED